MTSPAATLPFNEIQIWHSVRIQTKAAHDPTTTVPPDVLHAAPPTQDWPHGYYEHALVWNDPTVNWPGSGISGKLLLISF